MILPYTTDEIRQRADYLGKILEMCINTGDYAQIGRELGADPRVVEVEVERLKYTIQKTDYGFEIWWYILRMPDRWDWRPTKKGLALIGK